MRVGRGGVGAILAAIATLAVATVASAEEKIKIGLDLTISGYHAGWLVAQKLGYFKQQGLDVTINRGYGSGDTVRRSNEVKPMSDFTIPPLSLSRIPRAPTFA
jgi:ABC-type nitrate/sulfonate/bicarbonate transport system substrate-binding protein